MTQVTEQLQM